MNIIKIPKKIKMQRAINAKSDAGAGHTIGFNSCIEHIKELNPEYKFITVKKDLI